MTWKSYLLASGATTLIATYLASGPVTEPDAAPELGEGEPFGRRGGGPGVLPDVGAKVVARGRALAQAAWR